MMLVAPRVFRVPEGPAAREARRPHFVRRRASKPARALRTLRRPSHRWCLVCSWAVARSPETAITFARAGRSSTETAIAFVDAKWVFLVQLSGAVVMPVSRLPCWGCAVVLLVSTSTCCRASCAKKFALRGSVIVHARKYSPCTLKTPQNRRFFACWANYFAEEPLEGLCWESFFASIGSAARSCR